MIYQTALKITPVLKSFQVTTLLVVTFVVGCGAAPGFEGSTRKEISDAIGVDPEPASDQSPSQNVDAKVDLKPDLFHLNKSSVIFADKADNFSVDYQLLTKEIGIRNMNLGSLTFEFKPGVDVEGLELSFQVYSLATQDVLIERNLNFTAKNADGTLVFHGDPAEFEADTDKLIVSVLIKNFSLSSDGFGESGHSVETYFKMEDKGSLPEVRKSVTLKKPGQELL